jgi:hypothetical protein
MSRNKVYLVDGSVSVKVRTLVPVEAGTKAEARAKAKQMWENRFLNGHNEMPFLFFFTSATDPAYHGVGYEPGAVRHFSEKRAKLVREATEANSKEFRDFLKGLKNEFKL